MSIPLAQRLSSRSLYVCQRCRNNIRTQKFSVELLGTESKRWIHRNHVRKIITAEEEWKTRADAIEKGEKKSILDLLEERGYVSQLVGTRDELNRLLNQRRVGVYVGIDPTASSMHVGHMVPFMALSWLYVHGYSAHFLLGGFTSRIGDPTGRLKGREAQETSKRKANMAAMHLQLRRFGAFLDKYAAKRGYHREWAWKRSLINNMAWWNKMSVAEFMRVLGTEARIGPMLGRETVKNRMEKGEGMSFAEFSYPLIQAWDWWELYQQGVQIQIGGSDQFGNILAGSESIKQIRKSGPEWQLGREREKALDEKNGIAVTDDPLGFTVPLLTTSTGEKFGKSAGNAVWLDRDLTSTFDLYQFFLRSADADVEKYLKLLTLLPLPEIQEIMQLHRADESKRIAQHKLAREFVELVHGVEAADDAESQHRRLFNKTLSIQDIRESTQTITQPQTSQQPPALHPSLNKHAQPLRLEANSSNRASLPQSLVFEQPLSRILWHAELVASRTEGQRLINNRGVYLGGRSSGEGSMDDSLNFVPAKEASWEYLSQYIIENDLLIVRLGKWKVKIIKIIPDAEFRAAGLSCPGWDTATGIEEKRAEQRDTEMAEAEELRWKQKESSRLANRPPNHFGKVIEARLE